MPIAGPAAPAATTLPVPAEPGAERLQLRDSLLGGAEWEELGDELGLGDVLWASWGGALQEAGMERDGFAAVLSGYRREIWFWLIGDRRWEQVATGLAGRLLRRLPGG